MSEEPEFILPFDFMEVGNSFFVPTLRIPNMIYTIDTRAKAAGVRVKIYPTLCNDFIGVRVWRIG
jgi:hypothetical protein